MTSLTTFDADHDLGEILETFQSDGAVIIRDVMHPDARALIGDQLAPWIAGTPDGRDDFVGRQTTRTGALVARSEACRDLVTHPLVLELANKFLEPFTNKIQLHLTQVINIKPGQGTQPLHQDRLAWGGYIPKPLEPQFNTIWALTDFTEENGATRVVPGSNRWEDPERRATDDEKTQAVMSAGSVLLYSGSVTHGGGENRSQADRTGINITYCLAWLRTEENNYLSCPPEIAKDLEPDLQELLGYTMGNYALGYYSDPYELNERTDILAPEFALGRAPRGGGKAALGGD